ncbi:MAG: MBL fold metallo-hydrolase, partial [Dorea sp.]
IKKCTGIGKLPEGLIHPVKKDQTFQIGSLNVHPFEISHDANEPSGYRIESGTKAVAVATDLGKYDAYTVEQLKNLNAIILEANHDIHMLEVGPYPYPLKRRVMGEKGHLSNELSGRLLCDILHDGLQHVVLGHLSKENNYEELAYETVKLEITMGDNPYRGEDISLMVAKRDTVSEIIKL